MNLPKPRDFLASHLWRGQSEWYYHQTLKLLCAKFIKQASWMTQGITWTANRWGLDMPFSPKWDEPQNCSEMRKDSWGLPPWPLSPCHHRPTALPGRPAPERVPTAFLWASCSLGAGPQQSTLEPRAPKPWTSHFLSTPQECLCSYSFHSPWAQPHSGQVNCSHVLVRFPSAVRNWPLDPLHPKMWLWHTPRPRRISAQACRFSLRPWPLASGISMEAADQTV